MELAAQAEELKRFAQEYMVKAASDKQNVRWKTFFFSSLVYGVVETERRQWLSVFVPRFCLRECGSS